MIGDFAFDVEGDGNDFVGEVDDHVMDIDSAGLFICIDCSISRSADATLDSSFNDNFGTDFGVD